MILLVSVLLSGAFTYCLLTVLAARHYLAVRPRKNLRREPISVLKPLSGLDQDLESNLRTFFEQDYQRFEILFAARREDDPAVAVAERLCGEYPGVRSRILITGEAPYPNAKVYSLDRLIEAAENDLVVMSDSDTRVTREFLETVAGEFQDPKIGVATCPYRAVPGGSFWSRLEAIGMNTDFLAGILVARMLEGVQFAVGPTIVARRTALQSIGGVEELKSYLAEDFVMGQRAARAGHGVILSSYVIEHHIGDSDLQLNAAHRLRWVRSTRRSRPLGYLGQIFTMPLPLALGLWALIHAFWPVVLAAAAARFAAAWTISRRVLGAKFNWVLLPLEDLAAFGFWVAGFFGNTITWRGRRYRLYSDGQFELLIEG